MSERGIQLFLIKRCLWNVLRRLFFVYLVKDVQSRCWQNKSALDLPFDLNGHATVYLNVFRRAIMFEKFLLMKNSLFVTLQFPSNNTLHYLQLFRFDCMLNVNTVVYFLFSARFRCVFNETMLLLYNFEGMFQCILDDAGQLALMIYNLMKLNITCWKASCMYIGLFTVHAFTLVFLLDCVSRTTYAYTEGMVRTSFQEELSTQNRSHYFNTEVTLARSDYKGIVQMHDVYIRDINISNLYHFYKRKQESFREKYPFTYIKLLRYKMEDISMTCSYLSKTNDRKVYWIKDGGPVSTSQRYRADVEFQESDNNEYKYLVYIMLNISTVLESDFGTFQVVSNGTINNTDMKIYFSTTVCVFELEQIMEFLELRYSYPGHVFNSGVHTYHTNDINDDVDFFYMNNDRDFETVCSGHINDCSLGARVSVMFDLKSIDVFSFMFVAVPKRNEAHEYPHYMSTNRFCMCNSGFGLYRVVIRRSIYNYLKK
ncbi:uncharacterized protein LOC128214101 [Mya arenaria]|uniref:uncharacterized protein LOC128214101 n=1 Tax=Mya arenaria TaxID=6604 RepID=UPI0022E5BB16|nr:uncharacterized protein LOC128214101 [Mya arenaria]